MTGIGRLREVSRVTCVAVGVLQLVVAIRVALAARYSQMGAGELKCRGRVTKCRGLPGCVGVALGTCVTEVALHVVRVCRLGEIRRVAGIAVRVVQLVVAILVTLGANDGGMRSRQLEGRVCVIESCRFPPIRGMAPEACVTESALHMIGICRLRKCGCMAGVAVRILQLIVIVHMTLDAGQGCVYSAEREPGRLVGESTSPLHGRDLVAARTISGEGCRNMARRCGAFIGIPMAPITIRRRAGILLPPRVRMTLLTGEHAVPAEQRESGRLVLLDHVRDVP